MSDKTLTMFTQKIAELRGEKKTIDDKIAALELAYEAFGGEAEKTAKPKAKRKSAARPNQERTNDPKAQEKTIEYLRERTRPVSVSACAKYFGLHPAAAGQRLALLVRLGSAVRVGRGKYALSPKLRGKIVPANGAATIGPIHQNA